MTLGVMAAAAVAVAAIIVLFILPGMPKELAVQIPHYAVAADGRQLTVTAATNPLDTIESATAHESATSVKVIVLVSRQAGTAPAVIHLVDIPITLSSPLAGRTVLDAQDRPVPVKK